MQCVAVSTRVAAGVRASTARPTRRAGLVVRATSEESSKPTTSTAGSVSFRGKQYTESEWAQAVADGSVNQPAPATNSAADAAPAPSLAGVMAFSGPAPELINGRLAMLAFVSALGAELATGEPVLRQLAEEPTGVVLAAIAFATASLIPLLQSNKREAFAFFTPAAEMLNGRAAMIGFAALLIVEGVRGSALF